MNDGAAPKHVSSWYGLSEDKLLAYAQASSAPSVNAPLEPDEPLCRQCKELDIDRFWTGPRFCYWDDPGTAERWEEGGDLNDWLNGGSQPEPMKPQRDDVMDHICLVRGVRRISTKKGCALCRTLAAVHQRAHPLCTGLDEECFLLPAREDMKVKVREGCIKASYPTPCYRDAQNQYATNVHILFRKREAGSVPTRTNSFFLEGKDRWYLRLDARNAAPGRMRGNHSSSPQPSGSVNWASLKLWLGLCSGENAERGYMEHYTCRRDGDDHDTRLETWHRGGKHAAPVRCIDVETCCLVKIDIETHYVALSYVWGGVTVSRGDVIVGNKVNAERLPRVIQDAMVATRKLDERYLWVDLVSIDQEDPDDIQAQIARMDLIYRFADVTLVAATAEDANSCLPGVQDHRSLQEYRLQIGGRAIYCGPILKHHSVEKGEDRTIAGNTHWRTRGWTFQEELLSTRRLYFLDSEVVFQCKASIGYESQDPAGPLTIGIRPEGQSSYLSANPRYGWSFPFYVRLVEAYTARHLSVDSDILKAFLGITAWLEDRYEFQFVYGLPFDEVSLIAALMWTQPHTNSDKSRRNIFPSWAWVEWRGKTTFDHYIYEDNFASGPTRIRRREADWNDGDDEDVEVTIEQQAIFQSTLAISSIRRLDINTDVRRFKVVAGVPTVPLPKDVEEAILAEAGTDKEWEEYIREKRNREYHIPKAEDYDHHFLNEDGTVILPQTPYHDCWECAKERFRLLPILLGSQPDLANTVCNFVLLAHFDQPQFDDEPLHQCQDGTEFSYPWAWDHVFALLLRPVADNCFERVEPFIFTAKDWFNAEKADSEGAICLV